ncbi:hypothetical protein DM01DRAFT_1331690 [Hesseltinella vesiculosa]|uniref:Kinetochore protein Nuf2 N-terminal domain-containing protein n=1 Tax=Hesseltinella vesiculosa TaxID=101127 RepID=A0A1X2GW22_9FUNG|nr:hypothetical protein DM01DRAFT_1331690 [Hesseltinella vesiculosa]
MLRSRFPLNATSYSNHGGVEVDEQQRTQYDIPTLTISQIIKCLSDMNIHITNHDLIQPSSNRIVLVYESLLHLLIPWRTKYIQQAKENRHNTFGHHELRQDTTYMISIYFQMQYLLLSIRYRDFVLTDVAAPTSTRLQHILSAIINYVKFRDDMWKVFHPLSSHAEDVVLESQKLADEVDELTQKLADQKLRLQQQEPDTRKLEEWIEKERDNAASLESLAKQYHFESNEKKMARKVAKTKLKEIQERAMALVEEIRKLKTRKDYDHQEAQTRLHELKEQIEQRQEAFDKEQTKTQRADKKGDKLGHITRQLQSCVSYGQNIVHVWTSQEQMRLDIADLDRKINECATKLKEIDTKCNMLRRQVALYEAKTQKIYDHLSKKRETLELHMTKKKLELQEANETAAATRLELNQSKEAVRQLQLKIENVQQDLELDVSRFNDLCKRLLMAADHALDIPKITP